MALREEADKMRAIMSNMDSLLALKAMLVRAVPLRTNGRPDFPAIERIEAEYTNVDVPVLIL